MSKTRIISVANQKGGVGKTTTVANLAAYLCALGRRTLAIDLDHQANLTQHFGIKPQDTDESMAGVLLGKISIRDILHERGPFGLAPSGLQVEAVCTQLTGRLADGMEALRIALEPELGAWDYVLIDCPPSVSIACFNALVASDEILIPVEATSRFSVAGIRNIQSLIAGAKRRLNPKLKILGFLLTRYDGRLRITKSIEAMLLEQFGNLLLSTRIRNTVKLAEAAAAGKPVGAVYPASGGAKDYKLLAQEIDRWHGRNAGA